MTERELIALMAAAIRPHIKAPQFAVNSNEAAVNMARDLLAEVNRRFPETVSVAQEPR